MIGSNPQPTILTAQSQGANFSLKLWIQWWNHVSNIFDFHPDRGFMIQFDAYVSTGWQKNPLKLHGWSFHTSMFHRWVMPYHAVSPRLTWTTVMERFKAKQAVSMQVEKCWRWNEWIGWIHTCIYIYSYLDLCIYICVCICILATIILLLALLVIFSSSSRRRRRCIIMYYPIWFVVPKNLGNAFIPWKDG